MKAAIVLCILTFTAMFSGCLGDNNPPDEGKKYLIITIDAEAQTPRQSTDHVQRLIYGNFSDGRAGIIEMMDEADKVNVKLTFFVDVLEDTLYPGEIREVLHTIHDRGHDIQLHQHPWLIPSETWDQWENTPEWQQLGASRNGNLNCWDNGTAEFIFGEMMSIFDEENLTAPVASRGGSYHYNEAILNAMMKYNVTTSYNYNPPMKPEYFDEGVQPLFKWSNGMVEVPISYIPKTFGNELDRFDETYWEVSDLDAQIASYFDSSTGDVVLVMIFHSWSFLDKVSLDSSEYFEYKDQSKIKDFAAFLSNMPPDIEVITASELNQKITNGEFQISTEFETEEVSNHC